MVICYQNSQEYYEKSSHFSLSSLGVNFMEAVQFAHPDTRASFFCLLPRFGTGKILVPPWPCPALGRTGFVDCAISSDKERAGIVGRLDDRPALAVLLGMPVQNDISRQAKEPGNRGDLLIRDPYIARHGAGAAFAASVA
jgi:hypothetical protein